MTGDVEVAGAILKKGETCATNIEIGWHDLWRQGPRHREGVQARGVSREILVEAKR